MTKVFTLTIEVRENDSPQQFKFIGSFNGLEQIGMWEVVETLAKAQKEKLLKPAPMPPNYKPPSTSIHE